ncbi:MAG: ABC transporter permease [Marmoricola sp.]
MTTTTATIGTHTNPVLASIRADLFRLRRWPAVWVIVGVWLGLNEVFGYVLNYVAYNSGSSNFSTEGQSNAALLASIMPAGVPDTLVGGMPMFGGALMMVLGAIIAGSGFGWGTWKTIFTQGPSRVASVTGSLGALATIVTGVVLATLALDLGSSLVVAGVTSQHVVWPAFGAVGQSFGAALLIMGMWALAGFFLGVLARGPALSVGLGLVWLLVIENLLRSAGSLLSWLETFTHFLPGTAVGSLAGSLLGSGGPDSAPGVIQAVSGSQALWTTVAYVVLLPLVSVWLVRRRDVA